MKKMKLFPVVIIAIAFFTASCVDNTVSPQVEAIRGQQVEWMKAKTATELALAAFQTAQVDYQKAVTDARAKQTAFDEATRSWDLKTQEATYNYYKANNDVLLATAQNNLALAQNNLKYQLANTANNIASLNSSKATADYQNYQNQANVLYGLYQDELTLQGRIDNAKADLASNLTSYDNQLNSVQAIIDSYKTTLATYNATLTTLNSGSSASEIVKSLANTNTVLELKDDSLQTLSSNSYNTYLIAYSNASSLQNTITTYNNYLVILSDVNITPSSKADYELRRDNLKAAYDIAIAKYPESVQTAAKAYANYSTYNSQRSELRTVLSTNYSTINNLSYNGLAYAIQQIRYNINSVTQTIESYTSTINYYKDSKSLANAQIVNLTKELDDLNTKITAAEKQLAYLKGIVDKDLAA